MKKLTMMIAALAMAMTMQAQTKFHDVEANEAKGAVKSISMTVMGMPRNTTFTEDGKMQQDGLTDAKYDENGYIQSAKMSMQGQEAEVKFTWENGKLVSQTTNVMGQEIKQVLVYDENGLVKAVGVGEVVITAYTTGAQLSDEGFITLTVVNLGFGFVDDQIDQSEAE